MNKYILTYELFENVDYRPAKYRDFKKKTALRHKLLNMDKKTFDEIYSKHKWYMINNTAKPDIKYNLFSLVNMAYDEIGGHVRINAPNKVVQDKDLNFWTAINTNDDEFADAVIFGKNTKYGIKISGFGHMGTIDSTAELIDHLIKILNVDGYFLEASDKPAKIFLKNRVPVVHDINIINEIFPTNDAKFIDDKNTWYIRTVNSLGDRSEEILFGKPLI